MASIDWAALVKDAGEATGGGSYEPIPDGDYDLKVVEATAVTTSTGKASFKLKSQVQTPGPYQNRLIWDQLTISPENKNALNIFFAEMSALGVPKEFFTNNNPTNAQIESTLINRQYRAKIHTETYQGKQSNKIKQYYVTQAAATAAATPFAPPAAPAPAPAPAPAVAPPVAEAPVAPAVEPVAVVAAPPAPPVVAAAPTDAPF
jgi:hypothetical protein